MRQQQLRKQENDSPFRVLRIVRTPRDVMERSMAAGIYGLRIPEGEARPRRFYKVCAAELYPARSIEKLTDDAVRVGCNEAAFIAAIITPITTMIREKFRQGRRRRMTHVSGEFTPPDEPASAQVA
jgi:hypothetical protein